MGLFDKLLKGAASVPVDIDALPNDLAELRKLRAKAKYGKGYPYERKICQLGVELYRKGKLVAKPGDVYDVNTLLGEMDRFIESCHSLTTYTMDPAFEVLLLETGYDMVKTFDDMQQKDPTVQFNYPVDFVLHVYRYLPPLYSEGQSGQRNTPAARKFLRMYLNYQIKVDKEIQTGTLLDMFEVIAPGADGREELLNYIAMDFSLQAARYRAGKQVRIASPYENIQAMESMVELNTDIIGGSSVEKMLAEYRRGAEAGNAYAQYMLGKFYRWGRFVERDYEKSLEWLRQSAKQGLYVAVSDLSWLMSFPPEDIPKRKANEYRDMAYAWSRKADKVSAEVQARYANVFTDTLDGAYDHLTHVGAQTQSYSKTEEDDEEYRGRYGADADSHFSMLEWPDTITGPHGVTYYLYNTSANTAEYRGENGAFTTLHLSDRGAMSARNSDGYFYW